MLRFFREVHPALLGSGRHGASGAGSAGGAGGAGSAAAQTVTVPPRVVMNEMDGHNAALRELFVAAGMSHAVRGCGCGDCSCDTELWDRGVESERAAAVRSDVFAIS